MNIKNLAEDLGLEEDEYMELVELFIDTGRSEIDELQATILASDPEKAVSVAHSIKGAAGNLGLTELYGTAKQIEEYARSGSLDRVSESIPELQGKMEDLVSLARG